MANLLDFTLVESHVKKLMQENDLANASNAFYYLVLDQLLGLDIQEIDDAITDNFYLKKKEEKGRVDGVAGKDRGIDAVVIDYADDDVTIHFFNCKYTELFRKLDGWFPGAEIDKIVTFLNDLFSKEASMKNTTNPILYSKIQEIWDVIATQNPSYVVHICTNTYRAFAEDDRARFEREMRKYGKRGNFTFEYHCMEDWVALLTHENKRILNARIKAIGYNYFDKADGDIRALIAEIDALDLVRIVLNDDDARNKVNYEDGSFIPKFEILEDAFWENVRIYLKQKTDVNQNIKKTVLSDERVRFFYYNNGITITCSKFRYPARQNAPIIELENLQVVNGSQTIHTLYEALVEKPEMVDGIQLLVRIYETDNLELKSKIAEFTNSQNPVKNRDVRSIDYRQIKLQKEFQAKGLFYERKRREFADQPRRLRIDAEKTGQVLYAFYNKMPTEAKNKKRVIFDEKHYTEIFNEQITADSILLPYRLMERIEEQVRKVKRGLLSDKKVFLKDSFLLHSSYYVLYLLGRLAELSDTSLSNENIEKIWEYYPQAIGILRRAILKARRGSADTPIHPFQGN